jgi:hypothetical protein
LQSIGANRTPGIAGTFRDRAYLADLVADLVAWLASLVALRSLPVYVVQSVLAGSIAVTVLLARVLLKVRLRRVDLAAIAVTVAALAVLAASASPEGPTDLSAVLRWTSALALVPVAAAGLVCVRRRAAGPSGAVAGLAFGGTAVCARAVTVPPLADHSLGAVVVTIAADPLAWSLVGFAIAGLLLYAAALEYGDVSRVTAVLWVAEVLGPSAVGLLVLGNAVRPGWGPAVGIALLAALGSAAFLASAPGQIAATTTTRSARG